MVMRCAMHVVRWIEGFEVVGNQGVVPHGRPHVMSPEAQRRERARALLVGRRGSCRSPPTTLGQMTSSACGLVTEQAEGNRHDSARTLRRRSDRVRTMLEPLGYYLRAFPRSVDGMCCWPGPERRVGFLLGGRGTSDAGWSATQVFEMSGTDRFLSSGDLPEMEIPANGEQRAKLLMFVLSRRAWARETDCPPRATMGLAS